MYIIQMFNVYILVAQRNTTQIIRQKFSPCVLEQYNVTYNNDDFSQ